MKQSIQSKMLGGILLIVGTCMGAGILALPITSAPSGFFYSSLLLISCWVLMAYGAFLILEVNLWLPANNNIISMAKATLGDKGAIVAWVSYLLLFYCVLAAYISSGSDILRGFMSALGLTLPLWGSALLFLVIFGYVVYRGIQSVDYVNRALMLTKGSAFILLIVSMVTYVGLDKLQGGYAKHLVTAVSVMITSFGYSTIIPSLRTYFDGNIPALRKTVIIGSAIPLICYIFWNLVVMGVVPRTGDKGLIPMLTSGHSTTELSQSISYFLNSPWITFFARVFTSIAVATSFLGVSLGLTDFLADGFNLNKVGKNNIPIYSAAYIPPLILVLFFQNAFILGLSYGGIFSVILLALLPALMAWFGRYRRKISHGYEVMGGKVGLILVMIASISIIIIGISGSF